MLKNERRQIPLRILDTDDKSYSQPVQWFTQNTSFGPLPLLVGHTDSYIDFATCRAIGHAPIGFATKDDSLEPRQMRSYKLFWL